MKYSSFQPTGFDIKGLGLPEQQDWIVAGFRHRDGDILEESNWEVTCKELPEGDNVEIHRFGHWAVGWIELILVRPDTPESRIAEEIEGALSDYPVLSDDDYSNRCWNAIHDEWENMSLCDRIELCAEEGESIFAARHLMIPDSVYQVMSDRTY